MTIQEIFIALYNGQEFKVLAFTFINKYLLFILLEFIIYCLCTYLSVICITQLSFTAKNT